MKIKTAQGVVIYIDPYGESYAEFADSADILLVTHGHSDHNLQYLVTKKSSCTVITYSDAIKSGVYGQYTIGNVKVTAVPAYNGYHAVNSCVGYIVEFNGIKLYHAGDTGLITEMSLLADKNITYALLPIDGVYTMSPEGAVQAANAIKAHYNIPIHTMPPPDTYDTAKVRRFAAANKIVVKHGQTIALHAVPVGVMNREIAARRFTLNQNYPNPFNSRTTISFTIPQSSRTSLKIFDLLGREAATVADEFLEAGDYSRQWDADLSTSGIYFYRIQSGELQQTKKMLYLR